MKAFLVMKMDKLIQQFLSQELILVLQGALERDMHEQQDWKNLQFVWLETLRVEMEQLRQNVAAKASDKLSQSYTFLLGSLKDLENSCKSEKFNLPLILNYVMRAVSRGYFRRIAQEQNLENLLQGFKYIDSQRYYFLVADCRQNQNQYVPIEDNIIQFIPLILEEVQNEWVFGSTLQYSGEYDYRLLKETIVFLFQALIQIEDQVHLIQPLIQGLYARLQKNKQPICKLVPEIEIFKKTCPYQKSYMSFTLRAYI